LLAGIHQDSGKTYRPGDIIETDKDLMRLNRGFQKIEKLTEAVPISEMPTDDDLSRMTVVSLRELAEREEIDLGDATLKTDILETIRQELTPQTNEA